MEIKLKKEVLESGGLCSSSSHQGFITSDWTKLNAGKTITVDSIPDICKDKIEQVEGKGYKAPAIKKGGK